MKILFTQILNMSFTASVVILLVLAMRFLLRREPKIYSYALWAVVLFRLLCPISLTGDLSVLNFASSKADNYTRVEQTAYGTQTFETERYSTMNYIPAQITIAEQEPEAVAEVEKTFDWKALGACVWLIGAVGMGCSGLVSFRKLKKQLSEAIHWKKEVYLTDQIETPFVLGLWKPKIYLPIALDNWERVYILAHERHHIRRGDPVFKLLAYIALCLHWFNPLVWRAFHLAEKDMEMSCDEAVIRRLGPEIRADYAQSLLRLSTGHRKFTGMPLAFGEGDTKGRVKNMAKWKKPSVWMTVLCLVVCCYIGVVCALNPKQDVPDFPTMSGPVSCGTGDLYYEVPEGCVIEPAECTIEDCGNTLITDGTNTIGGVNVYNAPDMTQEDWWTQLGLQEYDDGLCYFGCDWAGGIWSVEFISDEPEGTPKTVDRDHYFFLSEDGAYVYDMWFDLLTVDPEVKETILDSADVGNQGLEKKRESNGGILIKYVDFRIIFPKGMDYGDGEEITLDGKTVGGLKLRKQEQANDPDMFSLEWMEAIGVPEASDPQMGYMGSGSNYSDYEINFFLDVPVERDEAGNIIRNEEGNAVLDQEVTHYFFVNGLDVYDLWFYNNRLPNTTRESVLKTCAIQGVTDIAAMADALAEEESALQQCRDVLTQIQSSLGYKIETRQENGDSALNDITNFTDWIYDNDWMQIAQIPESGGSSIAGELLVDGQHYECDSTKEWKETTRQDAVKPWLARFQWDDTIAAYMDTMTQADGTTVMLRIDEAFAEGSDQQPHYFVNFVFDTDGAFRNVYIQVNLFTDNEICRTESIASLEAETVRSEMLDQLKDTSIQIAAVMPKAETGLKVINEETILQQCSDVVTLVRNSARHLHSEAIGPGEERTVTDTYKLTNGETLNGDCLHLEVVNGERQEAFLMLAEENKFYHGEALAGEELQWREVSFEEFVYHPQQGVLLGKTYMQLMTYDETITNSTGNCYMVTYHEPYMEARVGAGHQAESFQMGFQFDQQGNFVELHILAYDQDDEINVTESIVSLGDEESVRNVIDQALQQALAQING